MRSQLIKSLTNQTDRRLLAMFVPEYVWARILEAQKSEVMVWCISKWRHFFVWLEKVNKKRSNVYLNYMLIWSHQIERHVWWVHQKKMWSQIQTKHVIWSRHRRDRSRRSDISKWMCNIYLISKDNRKQNFNTTTVSSSCRF